MFVHLMPNKCSWHDLGVFVTVFVLFLFFTLVSSVLCCKFSCSGSFSSILFTVCFFKYHIFNTFSQKDVLFTLFGFLEYFLPVLLLFCRQNQIVENHGHFFNFVVKTVLIWLVLVGFFCLFSQSETVCNLHLCYKFALVLQEKCTSFSANQNWVIFSCNIIPREARRGAPSEMSLYSRRAWGARSVWTARGS